jgi:hypothetical protein
MNEPSNKPNEENAPSKDAEIQIPAPALSSEQLPPDAFSHLENYKSKRLPIPKGVYRFKTHEEANEWWDKMMARAKTPEE